MTNQHTTMPYPYPNPKPEETAVFFLREYTLPQLEGYIADLEAKAAESGQGVAQHLLSTIYGVKYALDLVRSTVDTHAPIKES